jgi:hypothetical protein
MPDFPTVAQRADIISACSNGHENNPPTPASPFP